MAVLLLLRVLRAASTAVVIDDIVLTLPTVSIVSEAEQPSELFIHMRRSPTHRECILPTLSYIHYYTANSDSPTVNSSSQMK